MTLTFDIPDEVACRLLAIFPEEQERNYLANILFSDALNPELDDNDTLLAAKIYARFDPERDSAECVAVIEAELADMEKSDTSMTFEEAKRRWREKDAERQVIYSK